MGTCRPMVWFGKNWFLGGAKFLATDAIFGQVRFHPLGHFSLHEIFRNQNNKEASIQGGKKNAEFGPPNWTVGGWHIGNGSGGNSSQSPTVYTRLPNPVPNRPSG